jgi:hypothetical protein
LKKKKLEGPKLEKKRKIRGKTFFFFFGGGKTTPPPQPKGSSASAHKDLHVGFTDLMIDLKKIMYKICTRYVHVTFL